MAFVCGFLALKSYPSVEPAKGIRVDYPGIAVLSLFLLDILLLMEWGGDEVECFGMEFYAMPIIAIVLLAAFVLLERRASEPILAPPILKNNVVVQTSAFMFVTGFALIGASTYISFFGIDVLGFTAMEAREYAMAMIIGMITSVVSGV